MAKLRKANAYSKRTVVPYTRASKKRTKGYIKTVPPSKIVKFLMGNQKDYEAGKLPYELKIVTTEDVQVRSNALEAVRQYLNKKLDKTMLGQYYFKIIPFPHHIQRENKMLTGAGADRMQTGMQLAFGKTVGRAAIVKKGKPIFHIAVANEKGAKFARSLIKQIKPKMPSKIKIISREPKKKRIE
jgi:large subunit ribosomal protein L10e